LPIATPLKLGSDVDHRERRSAAGAVADDDVHHRGRWEPTHLHCFRRPYMCQRLLITATGSLNGSLMAFLRSRTARAPSVPVGVTTRESQIIKATQSQSNLPSLTELRSCDAMFHANLLASSMRLPSVCPTGNTVNLRWFAVSPAGERLNDVARLFAGT